MINKLWRAKNHLTSRYFFSVPFSSKININLHTFCRSTKWHLKLNTKIMLFKNQMLNISTYQRRCQINVLAVSWKMFSNLIEIRIWLTAKVMDIGYLRRLYIILQMAAVKNCKCSMTRNSSMHIRVCTLLEPYDSLLSVHTLIPWNYHNNIKGSALCHIHI